MRELYRKIDDIVDDEYVNKFTDLDDNRYGLQKFYITEEVKSSFDHLPLDPYCGAGRGAVTNGKHRYRRYDDFKAIYDFDLEKWKLELLPHRPFIQHPKFNKAVGGIPRKLESLKIKPDLEMNSILNAFGFDKQQLFYLKIHQIRVITSKEIQGIAIAEGAHRDGQEWQIVAVFDRMNVKGGQSQFLSTDGGEPFFAHTLQPGEVVCNEDARMWHNATDLSPIDLDKQGYRDIFIVATNRWHKRRYGVDFEEASMQSGVSNWELDRPDEIKEVAESS